MADEDPQTVQVREQLWRQCRRFTLKTLAESRLKEPNRCHCQCPDPRPKAALPHVLRLRPGEPGDPDFVGPRPAQRAAARRRGIRSRRLPHGGLACLLGLPTP